MKKNISTIVLVVIFLIGLFVLLYPTISNYYNKKVGSYTIAQYDNQIEELAEDEAQKIIENAIEYNKKLLTKSIRYKSGESTDEEYLSQLKLDGSSIIGYIEINKIDLKLPIYHGTGEPVLQVAIGHLEGSALPIGGLGNHSVLSGHRGLPSAKLFTNLDKLQIGDQIVIKTFGQVIKYTVTEINIVEPHDISLIKPEAEKDLLTLVTCTPYGINSHRLLIKAENSEYVKSDEIVINSDARRLDSIYIAPLIATPIILIILLILLINKIKNKFREV